MNPRRARLGGLVLPLLFLFSCATTSPVKAAPRSLNPAPAEAGTLQYLRRGTDRAIGGVSAVRLANLSRGIDLGNVFMANANPLRYATRITAADLEIIRSAGFTFCRLPINPGMLFDSRRPSELRPNIRYVDRLVHLILANGLSVVIDPIHVPGRDVRFERAISSSPAFAGEIGLYWRAIARRYAGLDPNRVFFEIMNEPAASRVAHAPVTWWPPVQERLARVIRAAAPRNTIVATGDQFGGIPGLLSLKPLAMQDVIYSFHFYEPMTFTHQGATWVGPVARVLAGVPYPSTPENIAPLLRAVHLPAARRALYSYGEQRWDAARIRAQIAQAAAWGARNHVPVFDGEFGVLRTFAPPASRYRWLHDVTAALEHFHIGWAMWNFDAGFNLVRYRYPGVLSGPQVDERLLAALGLRRVVPAAVSSPITPFDRKSAGRIVLPVSWLGSLWVQGRGQGSASLATAKGAGAPSGIGAVARVTHAGTRLWVIRPNITFPVSSGQRYHLGAWAALFGPGSCSLEIVDFAADGQPIGRAAFGLPVTVHGRWQHLGGTFHVPRRTARIGVRWSGRGRAVAELSSITLARLAP